MVTGMKRFAATLALTFGLLMLAVGALSGVASASGSTGQGSCYAPGTCSGGDGGNQLASTPPVASAPVASAPVASPSALAFTGIDVVVLVAIGAALVCGGIVVVRVSGRRRLS